MQRQPIFPGKIRELERKSFASVDTAKFLSYRNKCEYTQMTRIYVKSATRLIKSHRLNSVIRWGSDNETSGRQARIDDTLK